MSAQIVADTFRVLDMALIFVAALVAKIVYIDNIFGDGSPILPYAIAAGTCAIITNSLFRSSGVDHSATVNPGPFRPARLFTVLVGSFMLLLSLAYILKVSDDFSRGWLITWFALSFLLLVVNRALYGRAQRWLVANGLVARHVIIIGEKNATKALSGTLEGIAGVRIAATYEPGTTIEDIEAARMTGVDPTRRLDDIIIVSSGLETNDIRSILSEISGLPAQIRVCVDPLAYDLPFHGVSSIGQTQFINVRRTPMSSWGHLLKNIEDYGLGALLLVLLLPVFGLIALAIKLDSPGPVFFRQRRHGLNHSIIKVFKFRTMTVMEDGDVIKQASKDDDRITRVGAFLRRTSLDELPQLINVLRGEMSLVGPRPHAVAHNEQYRSILKQANYASRHLVKPGITGWAQINGYRGPTSEPNLMRERVRCDLEYIDNWTIWFDLEILLLTPFYGFVGKNAL